MCRRSAVLVLVTWAAHAYASVEWVGETMLVDALHHELADVVNNAYDKLTVRKIKLPDVPIEIDLQLARFDVWAPDAVLRTDDKEVPIPRDAAHFRGRIMGDVDSHAVLITRGNQTVSGYMQLGDGAQYELYHDVKTATKLHARLVGNDTSAPSFPCAVDKQHAHHRAPEPDDLEDHHLPPHPKRNVAATIGDYSYTARMAIDTDIELRRKFPSQAALVSYLTDMVAYITTIYEKELDTSLKISYLQTYEDISSITNDPWCGTCDTDGDGKITTNDYLVEFRNYWRANRRNVVRSVAHLISGKTIGGGIGYVGVTCDPNWAYSVSTDVGNKFNKLRPSVALWDTLVVAHETGHALGSPHSHCYANYPNTNYPDSIDHCYTGECGGTAAWPKGCPGAYQRCGTIMSYCQLFYGGVNNVQYTFGGSVITGNEFQYGYAPKREADRMSRHIRSRYVSGYRSCLEKIPPTTSEAAPNTETPTVPPTHDPMAPCKPSDGDCVVAEDCCSSRCWWGKCVSADDKDTDGLKEPDVSIVFVKPADDGSNLITPPPVVDEDVDDGIPARTKYAYIGGGAAGALLCMVVTLALIACVVKYRQRNAVPAVAADGSASGKEGKHSSVARAPSSSMTQRLMSPPSRSNSLGVAERVPSDNGSFARLAARLNRAPRRASSQLADVQSVNPSSVSPAIELAHTPTPIPSSSSSSISSANTTTTTTTPTTRDTPSS